MSSGICLHRYSSHIWTEGDSLAKFVSRTPGKGRVGKRVETIQEFDRMFVFSNGLPASYVFGLKTVESAFQLPVYLTMMTRVSRKAAIGGTSLYLREQARQDSALEKHAESVEGQCLLASPPDHPVTTLAKPGFFNV